MAEGSIGPYNYSHGASYGKPLASFICVYKDMYICVYIYIYIYI